MAARTGYADSDVTAKPTVQKLDKWAAIAGRWKFAKGKAKYLGPDEGATHVPFGIALGAVRFRDGTISTIVKLERNERAVAGILLGYQSPNTRHLAVQIGGFDRAYVIAEFQPEAGWISRAAAGSLANLSIDQHHHLLVKVSGQSIEMTVDDVDVLRYILSQPIDGTGTGLYAGGDAEIEFSETNLVGVEPKIFVIMPFKEPFDTLYKDVIHPVATEIGFDVVRVDEIYTPGVILNDIQRQIEQAHVVVAEISTHNPNVFYELGYAHALRKPAVLLVRRQESGELPFDIRSYRAIFYDDSIGGKRNVERNLKQHLSAILRDS